MVLALIDPPDFWFCFCLLFMFALFCFFEKEGNRGSISDIQVQRGDP